MHRNHRALPIAALIFAAFVLLALSGIALAQGIGMGMGMDTVKPAAPGAVPIASYLVLNGAGHIALNGGGAVLCNAC